MNAAAYRLAHKYAALKWLHWVHSATRVDALFEKKGLELGLENDISSWPNANPVCFNYMSAARIAENFHCDESDVIVIPHPIDVCEFLGLSAFATALYRDRQLYLADYINTFPVRLDRGKQVDWVIRIMPG